MAKRQLKIGDRVRCTHSDGSFKDGTIKGSLRTDGYYPVAFDDKAYLGFGVQHVMPSHLKLLKTKNVKTDILKESKQIPRKLGRH